MVASAGVGVSVDGISGVDVLVGGSVGVDVKTVAVRAVWRGLWPPGRPVPSLVDAQPAATSNVRQRNIENELQRRFLIRSIPPAPSLGENCFPLDLGSIFIA